MFVGTTYERTTAVYEKNTPYSSTIICMYEPFYLQRCHFIFFILYLIVIYGN